MTNRYKRKQIASKTLEIIKDGFYNDVSEGGGVISLKDNIEKCDNDTKILSHEDWEGLFEKYNGTLQWQGRTSKFEVTEELSITCCRRLYEEGFKNVTCLNFASAKHPCGGMVNRSIAQEESLGLCSSLYSSLSKQEAHYEANKKDPKNGVYQDSLINSPGCPVFRDDVNYHLLERPFYVNFISCPAVNATVTKAPLSVVRETMRRRTKAVLSVAADEGCDALVLGAWGCGVFGNDVNDVVEYFKEYLLPNSNNLLLGETTGSFANTFPEKCLPTVVFALGKDSKNQLAFRNAFPVSQC
jgi:uncharacterized protein (TIGR02452 family)